MIRKLVLKFMADRQFRNAMYLLAGSLATAFFGFVFWIIAARLFDAHTVGLATVLISLSTLISLLSLAGFDSSFVRFLPKSKEPNRYVNSGIIVTSGLSVILSVVFLIFSYFTTPDIRDIISDPLIVVLFVILTVASSLNLLTNSVFIAHRHASFVLLINVLFNLFKVALPFAMIDYGAVGIFAAAGVAQLVGLAISLYCMHRAYKFRLRPTLDVPVIRQTFRYTSSVYAGSVLNLLPPTILPLIITTQLNPSEAAYYYMAFNIATIIYTVAYSAMQSAFAESSHDESLLRVNINKAVRLSLLLVVPSAVLASLLGNAVLGVFGAEYAANAAPLLIILSLSAVFVTLYSALGAIMKVAHDTRSFIAMNVVYAISIIGLSFSLMPQYGLLAVGYGWAVGNILAIISGTALHMVFRQKLTAQQLAD